MEKHANRERRRRTSLAFPRLRRRIAEKRSFYGARPLLLVAIGDSVTQGWMEEGVLDQESVYHARVLRELRHAHPLCTFDALNAGAGGETVQGGLARAERDVVAHQPDLVVIGFGLNDCFAGDGGLDAFRDRMGSLLDLIGRETEAEPILLTPNMMCHADNPRIPDRWRQSFEEFRERQVSGTLARYAEVIRAVGAERGVPVADVYAEWERLRRAGVETDDLLANGLNHPNAEGHAIAAQAILDVLYKGRAQGHAGEGGLDSPRRAT